MNLRHLLTISLCFVGPVTAGELAILPTTMVLDGPRAAQTLVVVEQDTGRVRADRTSQAKFTTSQATIATVDALGIVRPHRDGEVTITATVNGQTATAKVRVTNANTATAPSFRNDILPMLTRTGCNSGACHGALAGKGGLKLSLRGYDPETDHFVLTRQAAARRVDRTQPEQSLLILKGTRTIAHGGGTRIEKDSEFAATLLAWVKSEAPGAVPSEATITKLEVFPKAALLQPKDTLRTVVQATYSDGRVVDVTRLAKFVSSETPVADVDEDGRIKVSAHGEAAISAIFDNRVASLVVTAPFPQTIDEKAFAAAPTNNFIDTHVQRKWREIRLTPSGTCTDHEFIRRAFLDAAGILPTPAEVTAFVSDPSPTKRAKLIDALVERPEFVDYWSYKWSDLLLVSTRKLPQPAMWSFYRAIRKNVADNKPWDQFARELLLANGSTLHQGGGNFYVLHKDVADLTESTAVTFLGMSITCARCHNHPLEKWTQDQYWSLANLFSRVALKNGDRAGEVIVQTSNAGDVLHPRRSIAMPPTPLDGRPMDVHAPHDRRAYFADWLTSPENPYFAKALVNRVWKNFLGRGLVEAEDDLRETNPATNPELFDALAKEFISRKYDVKQLVRLIMNSSTYQRSAQTLPANVGDDRFYSHYIVRRLSGEVILDALAQVTAVPTPFTQVYTGVEGGTAATGNYPDGVRALQLPDSRVASRFLDSFGRPDRVQTCSCERQQDSTVGQALMLNNGQVLNDKLRAPKSVLATWLAEKIAPEEAVRRVYARALCRPPTATELKKLTTLLNEYDKTPKGQQEALEDLFWAILTNREFLFNH